MMEIFLATVVVVLRFIFSCSITNFLNQLPNCGEDTRAALDRTILELGCFIHFRQNVNMLKNKIEVLTTLIQELGSHEHSNDEVPLLPRMVSVQEEAVQVIYESGQVINNPWYRMWTISCYKLSYRVADMILKIECMLNPGGEGLRQPFEGSDGIPGIAVVFLIAYALTNAVPGIIGEVVYPFKLKKNLQTLRNKIHLLATRREKYENKNCAKVWVTRKVGLLIEGEVLSEEVGDVINHWYKGWTGSRYRLCKRVEALISKFNNMLLELQEETVAGSYNEIDWIVIEMAYTFKLEKHLKMLKNKLHRLVTAIEENKWTEELIRRKVHLLMEGERLSEEAEDMNNHWYKGWTGSRYRLSKRMEDVDFKLGNELEDEYLVIEHGGCTRDVISYIDGISSFLPAAITDIRHYLHFKTHIETLHTRIPHLQVLRDELQKSFTPPQPYLNEVEAAIHEGLELMKKAEGMDQYCYKLWPGSRYELSKRLVKLIAVVNGLTANYIFLDFRDAI